MALQAATTVNGSARAAQRVLRVVLLWLCAATTCVQAHDARPVAVDIVETLPGLYQAALKIPPTVEVANQPRLVWPGSCVAASGGQDAAVLMRCDEGLAGQEFVLDYPAFNPSLASFFRLALLDGTVYTAMLPPSAAVWLVPVAMTPVQVAKNYLLLGVEHIIGGLDHLLFVLGLLVIARTPRRILLTITGFTLAHSITLSLSSLGLLSVPIVPVEATIALSILFLAHEISRRQHDSLTWRKPLLVAFGFGLLHGLGFASALGEIGLAQNEVLISLLFFNLGVETGQVLFILAVLALVGAGRRLLPAAATSGTGVATWRGESLASYVIGVPAAYWLIDRVAQFLA